MTDTNAAELAEIIPDAINLIGECHHTQLDPTAALTNGNSYLTLKGYVF